MKTNISKIKKLTAIAMFCALSYVCTVFVKIPGIAGFLTLDVKDALIVLCSLLFGPFAGAVIAVTVPLLEMITISGTGWYGFLMNALSSVTFSLTAGLIYKYHRTLWGAVIGLVCAVCSVTAVMLLANLLITPLYIGGSSADVAAMIPKILFPFNLVKASLNAALVMLLYKPLSKILKKTSLLPGSTAGREEKYDKKKAILRSVAISAVAVLIIAASLYVVLVVL